MHLFERDIFLCSVFSDAASLVRGKAEKGSNSCACLASCPEFQHLSKEHQCSDDGRSLKISSNIAGPAPKGWGKKPGDDGCKKTINIGDADAKSDQSEHVRAAVCNRLDTAYKKGPPS